MINETLIRPAAVLQYSNLSEANRKSGHFVKDLGAGYDGRRLATFARQRTGLRRIQDDLCGVYRDEHSRPFAVKTKSQINLHLFATNDTDDVDETDNGGEEVTPVRTFVPRVLPMTNAPTAAAPLPPLPTHSSPSKSIILPPPVSSAQLSPKHTNGATKTSSNFLAKLMNRSTASTADTADDDQQRLVDDDQLRATIVASSSLGLQSFSSTDIDPFDDDSGELNALLSHNSCATKPGNDSFPTKVAASASNNANAGARMTSRRRSSHHQDANEDNDEDAPGAIRATYDFLNNW